MRLIRALLAGILLAVLIVAIPVGLAAMVGNPLEVWPDIVAGDISNRVILAVLAAVAWVLWLQFTIATIAEFISALRRVRIPRHIPGIPRLQQGFARALVSAVLMVTPAVVSITGPGLAAAAPAPPVAAAQHAPVAALAAHVPSDSSRASVDATEITIGTDTARTWWDLAEQYTGDGTNWRTIFDLNADMPQPGGARPTQTGALHDGWVIRVPADTANTDIASEQAAKQVTVQPGDTLSGIAAETTGDAENWPDLYQASRHTVQPDGRTIDDPDLIFPGQHITIPQSASPAEAVETADESDVAQVTVQPGDTLSGIAAETTGDAENWPDLYQASRHTVQPDGRTIDDPDLIMPGWQITIPQSGEEDLAAEPDETAPATDGDSAVDDGLAEEPGSHTQSSAEPPAEDHVPAAPAAPRHAEPSETIDPPDARGAQVPAAAAPEPQHRLNAPAQSPGVEHIAGEPAAEADAAMWPSWLTATGGGMVLAALLAAGIYQARRRALRWRRPGRAIAPIPAEQAPVMHAIAQAAATAQVDTEWLSQALRHALSTLDAMKPSGRVPDVVAVKVAADELQLVLSAPAMAPPPAPWTETDGQLRWHLDRTDEFTVPERLADKSQPPLFPLLATVGHTADGAVWLLDLEMIGSLRIDGDRAMVTNLLRYIALELANNSWSQIDQVLTVGFGDEIADALPQTVQAVDAATAVDRTADWLETWASAARSGDGDDVAAMRLTDDVDGAWNTSAVLVAALDNPEAFTDGFTALGQGLGRLGVAVAGAAGDGMPPGWEATLSDDGMLSIPQLGIDVIAEQIPADEAADVATLLAAVTPIGDISAPPATTGGPVSGFITEIGGLRDEYVATEPAPGPRLPGAHVRDGSLLPKAADEYQAAGATTDDVVTLAPVVTPVVAEQIQASDPHLDQDVADWHDQDCRRPKIRVLGPIDLRASAQRSAPDSRVPQLVELAVYLAMHPEGVTADKLGTDLWPTGKNVARRAKQMVSYLRTWLGKRASGDLYLPTVKDKQGRAALYRLEDTLVDVELMTRLHVRGKLRGPDGIADLQTALDLVDGRPFEAQRDGGYAWLTTGGWDHSHVAQIDDLAHLAVTAYLDRDEGRPALEAARTALLAGSGSDIPLLDCAKACRILGLNDEASQYLERLQHLHDEINDEALPDRTSTVLAAEPWASRQVRGIPRSTAK